MAFVPPWDAESLLYHAVFPGAGKLSVSRATGFCGTLITIKAKSRKAFGTIRDLLKKADGGVF
jgi:hypothetical protein